MRNDPEIGIPCPAEALGDRPLVLVVEDHALHGRLLRQVLKRSLPACEVEQFADGSTAARRLRDPSRPVPALLVLDLDVPGRSGHELLTDRARDQRLAAVPAVIVTSSRAAGDRERSLALGASLHLEKPTDADGFLLLADRLAALLG